MSFESANIGMEYVQEGATRALQLTDEWAYRFLDVHLQPVVQSDGDTTPPVSPSNGDVYILASTGCTGLWAGHENKVALYYNSLWWFWTPKEGWIFYNETDEIKVLWNGSAWVKNTDVTDPLDSDSASATGTKINSLISALELIGILP
jgi:hypothetical protein